MSLLSVQPSQPSNEDSPLPRINRRKATQLIIAGFVATLAMTILTFLVRATEIPAVDYGILFGSILNPNFLVEGRTGTWWGGLLWHFVNGSIIYPILFDLFTDQLVLPQGRWGKGVIWGGILWLVTGLTVSPVAGAGFFYSETGAPGTFLVVDLVAWLVYGFVLDGMTRIRIVHQLEHRKAA